MKKGGRPTDRTKTAAYFRRMGHKPPAKPAAPLNQKPSARASTFRRKVNPDAQLDLFEREALRTLLSSPRRGAVRSR